MDDNQVRVHHTLAAVKHCFRHLVVWTPLFVQQQCGCAQQFTASAIACRREAERDAATEPLLSSFLYASILAHDSFERALAFVLSNRLANAVMLPTQLFETFYAVLISDPDVREGALADVEACRDRVSGDKQSALARRLCVTAVQGTYAFCALGVVHQLT